MGRPKKAAPLAVDPYRVLRVGYRAPAESIRRAYLTRAMECHPDKGGTQETMGRVTEAWAALSTPAARAKTEKTLQLVGAWPAALCPRCDGRGEVYKGLGVRRETLRCPVCEGLGAPGGVA